MNWLKRILAPSTESPTQSTAITPATTLVRFEGESLDLADITRWHNDLPHPDFMRAREWADRFDEANYATAWLTLQRTWLQWLASAFGNGYEVHESADALLVTRIEPRATKVALDYLTLTQRRVGRSLGRLATERLPERQVVLLIEGDDDYYRYLSAMYPDEGEFPMSAGVHFNGPGPHFVVNGSDLTDVEATIVHEMTHAYVAHLPIPAWLNEGLAVNMEIAFGRVADAHHLIDLEKRHRQYWSPDAIQDFWSGRAYERPGEGNELSYDLGRLMVSGMSEHWPRFEAFALDADRTDSGAHAAETHLGIDLGEYVRHYLEREDGEWGPRPAQWAQNGAAQPPAPEDAGP